MRDQKIQQVAAMLIARQWARTYDFGDEPTDTFVQWPPEPPRPGPMRTARGTVPPEGEYEDEYEVEYDLE